jgi:hypothetical protein
MRAESTTAFRRPSEDEGQGSPVIALQWASCVRRYLIHQMEDKRQAGYLWCGPSSFGKLA